LELNAAYTLRRKGNRVGTDGDIHPRYEAFGKQPRKPRTMFEAAITTAKHQKRDNKPKPSNASEL